MELTRKIGDRGEDMAADYLQKKGYEVLSRNYRYKRAEVDIIARINNLLVFVEVKYRKNNSFGNPEEFVNERKIELIQLASENYIDEIDWNGNIRFDIISILRNKKYTPEIEHFEDAF